MIIINKNNLDDKSLTNAEVIAILLKLSLNLNPSGFSRTLDVIGNLTGDREFTEYPEVYESIKVAEVLLNKKINS